MFARSYCIFKALCATLRGTFDRREDSDHGIMRGLTRLRTSLQDSPFPPCRDRESLFSSLWRSRVDEEDLLIKTSESFNGLNVEEQIAYHFVSTGTDFFLNSFQPHPKVESHLSLIFGPSFGHSLKQVD